MIGRAGTPPSPFLAGLNARASRRFYGDNWRRLPRVRDGPASDVAQNAASEPDG
jgi:hypothetical protein